MLAITAPKLEMLSPIKNDLIYNNIRKQKNLPSIWIQAARKVGLSDSPISDRFSDDFGDYYSSF